MNLVALATPVLAVLLLLAAHASAFLTLPGTLGCRLPLREARGLACGQRLGLKELDDGTWRRDNDSRRER